jgi:hypothetical protein
MVQLDFADKPQAANRTRQMSDYRLLVSKVTVKTRGGHDDDAYA